MPAAGTSCRARLPAVDAVRIFRHGDPPAATYTFKHALVQEAAYNALLRPRREEIHARIARTMAPTFLRSWRPIPS